MEEFKLRATGGPDFCGSCSGGGHLLSLGARLQLINTVLAEYDDQHPGTHHFPPFRLADVTSDGWANLRSPAIKAANTRAADSASRGLCHRWFDRATLSDNSQRFVIDALREVYEKLCKGPMFVSDGGVTRLHAASIQLGASKTYFLVARAVSSSSVHSSFTAHDGAGVF